MYTCRSHSVAVSSLKFLVGEVSMQFSCVVFVALLAFVSATRINQCNTVSRSISNDEIDISNCKKLPCILKRKTQTNLQFKLKPDKDIKKLTNTVYGRILGLPLPFVGTDNTDACTGIFLASTGEKVGCPLRAGQEYIYKNVINILPIFPTVNVDVHWGLTMENGRDLSCFEVPAKITN